MGAFSEKQGAIGNKRKDSRDDENTVKHTDCRRKSRSCKGFRRDMSELCSNKVVAVHDISAVWLTLLRAISRAL
jgi:hypothetical protein